MNRARLARDPQVRRDRENLMRAVRFDQPDWIPMTFHINAACWDHYGRDALWEAIEQHAWLFPPYRRDALRDQPSYPPYARAGEPFVDPWGCVWETTRDGIMGVVTKHPLESWDDFDSYQPPDPDTTTHWGPIDWERAAEEMGPSISQSCIPSGEIGHNHTWLRLIDIRGYERVLLDMADGDPRIDRLLDLLEAFNVGLVERYVVRAGATWMGFAEDLGMQRGPMLSPEQFRRHIKPRYQRMMALAREAGCIVHVHADGDLRSLVDDLLQCPIDVLNLQDRVHGIAWLRERLKGRVCLEVDIDRQQVTVEGSRRDIDDWIGRLVAELGGPEGGLMMIYGLYPGVPWENALAVMDAMERYAGYFRRP